ncbi:hypothetical protein LX32DRAFT_643880 [Colletotrichum zoysiae]|uniref:Glycoside hydrolase 131 catalytic N-terminal domain-containing protein n=1 Tax=Colletotrichum zoysiae TaxID=1216348 RepID=A0AAD9H985_9PEZI|nr:hypothetical protein LX32DRAFT_643880 [Colletotrichum zoysiae]
MAVSKTLVLLAMFKGIAGQNCTLSFDGRVPSTADPALFVSKASPFNPKFVLGQNVTWDQIIEFPNVPPTRFDNNGTKPIGLSLSDESIFASSSEGQEVALRRAELLVNGKNETVSGHKTWHISLRTDPTRPLNYTHEYVLAFQEAQDFQADFWSVKAGSRLEDNPPTSQKVLRVEGYKFDVPVKTFFETPLTDDVWHNIGINLDYPNNMISVLYSTDNNPLQVVTPPTFNNISGAGQTTLGETHIGLQKRPVGANLQNFLFNGTQPFGINEAIFLGGIFQDDSSTGCVTV